MHFIVKKIIARPTPTPAFPSPAGPALMPSMDESGTAERLFGPVRTGVGAPGIFKGFVCRARLVCEGQKYLHMVPTGQPVVDTGN